MGSPISIASIQLNDLPVLGLRLAGYVKSCSIAWSQALNIPTLDGLILDSWDGAVFDQVEGFAKRHRTNSLLLRIDRKNERWTERRGGYLVRLGELSSLWGELSADGFIPILLEPASPYSNRGALTCLLDTAARRLIIETVGAGFDASDILRSDLLPDERWEANLSGSFGNWQLDEPLRRTHLLSPHQFTIERERRLEKIGARLINPAFPRKAADSKSPEALRADAVSFLRREVEHSLLDSDVPQPLPSDTVQVFCETVLRLKRDLEAQSLGITSLSAAASVLADLRLVIWDFIPLSRQEIPLLWGQR